MTTPDSDMAAVREAVTRELHNYRMYAAPKDPAEPYADSIMQIIATQRAADKAALLAALPKKHDLDAYEHEPSFHQAQGFNRAIDAATAAIENYFKEVK